MVVNPLFPPVSGLIVKNFSLGIDSLISGTPQNTVRVGIKRFQIIGYQPLIVLKRLAIVIPMNRHGQCITDAETGQCTVYPICDIIFHGTYPT